MTNHPSGPSSIDATGSTGFGYAVIPLLFIFYFHYDISLTPLLYSYPTELFPYEWRSWGVAFTLIVTNASQIVGMFCNPIAMAKMGWRYYLVFCVLDALFIVAVWFLFPETKGKSLEELEGIFDNKWGGISEGASEEGKLGIDDRTEDDQIEKKL